MTIHPPAPASFPAYIRLLVAAAGCLTVTATHAERFVYFDQASFLNDLTTLGYSPVHESFENDNAWGLVRSSVLNLNTLPEITNLGLTWQNRFFPAGGVTTSDGGGNTHDGIWQFYASPHGGYGSTSLDCNLPGECSDGFTITSGSAGTLYGVGGWFTGASGPEIKFMLDGSSVIGAGGTGNNIWQFFGVIDTNGFSKAEIFDSSGTLNDQNLMWADDFTFATVQAAPAPAPLLSYSIIKGQQITGNLASLSVSDDDYVGISSQTNLSGSRAVSYALYIASSPLTTVSSMNLRLELGSDNLNVTGILMLYNFDTGTWDLIKAGQLPLVDTAYTLPDIVSPNAYIMDSDGQIQLRLLTVASTSTLPAGYMIRVDRISIEVTP